MTKSGVSQQLLGDLRRLIEEARQNAAQTVNSALVALYWKIGKRIRKEILNPTSTGIRSFKLIYAGFGSNELHKSCVFNGHPFRSAK